MLSGWHVAVNLGTRCAEKTTTLKRLRELHYIHHFSVQKNFNQHFARTSFECKELQEVEKQSQHLWNDPIWSCFLLLPFNKPHTPPDFSIGPLFSRAQPASSGFILATKQAVAHSHDHRYRHVTACMPFLQGHLGTPAGNAVSSSVD